MNQNYTIFQKPNALLIIALIALGIDKITHGVIHSLALTIYTILIIIWAYEEFTTGVNLFRKFLGGGILIMMAVSLFGQLRRITS